MAEAETETPAKSEAEPKAKGGKKKLLLILAPLVLLLGGGGAAVALVPGVRAMVPGLGGGGAAAAASAKTETDSASAAPIYVQMPELTVTLPNAGRPRQLRIKLALELAKHPKDGEDEKSEILTPRVNDALVLYLRTLRDAEVDGALSLDRMRGDLQRRLDLVLGEGVLRDVLITSMIIG